jgi:hypothetical protein
VGVRACPPPPTLFMRICGGRARWGGAAAWALDWKRKERVPRVLWMRGRLWFKFKFLICGPVVEGRPPIGEGKVEAWPGGAASSWGDLS